MSHKNHQRRLGLRRINIDRGSFNDVFVASVETETCWIKFGGWGNPHTQLLRENQDQ